jgi:predicted nucleic acid-binding protein
VEKLVLDTSVLIEYIILRSPYRHKVVRLFDNALNGKQKLYVNVVTLSEVLYVASRIYQVAGAGDPNRTALDFIEWIKSRAQVININEDLALRAGELKKKLHIALPDCYVIASAEAIGARPLFKRLEEEMRPIADALRKLGVKFLDEIEL